MWIFLIVLSQLQNVIRTDLTDIGWWGLLLVISRFTWTLEGGLGEGAIEISSDRFSSDCDGSLSLFFLLLRVCGLLCIQYLRSLRRDVPRLNIYIDRVMVFAFIEIRRVCKAELGHLIQLFLKLDAWNQFGLVINSFLLFGNDCFISRFLLFSRRLAFLTVSFRNRVWSFNWREYLLKKYLACETALYLSVCRVTAVFFAWTKLLSMFIKILGLHQFSWQLSCDQEVFKVLFTHAQLVTFRQSRHVWLGLIFQE